ncbi:polysaccharide deacetylase family protein [Streptomyces sp. NBC_00536]|uniref:polysaccharide deacetylase family protein n=1 Tax=Streptomyces sp. NBC_00536 TaxID=2975769 RepID=UPI002E80CB71|nr:polysaccharide deacetylase family protein [Streptomyces sp. NBC_00536]WUC80718.1 polysaccharide deacetylase family protein [Streptomyces sp. NBC_00536]
MGHRVAGTRGRYGVALAALLVAALGTACGSTESAPAVKDKKAKTAESGQNGASGAQGGAAANARQLQQARALAAKKWGLAAAPLAAPPAPKTKPEITFRKGFEVEDGDNLPPVFTTVPTEDKVVFLTIDDGAEKDPEFLKMMQELKIPYTAFLSDYLVRDNYAYFKQMQSQGVSINNHTLNHRYLPALPYEKQRQEICGMQDTIQKEFGKRPTLFRPPYGNYNDDTLRAAKSCGVKAVPIWNEEAFTDRMDWREEDKDLHPGDIILTHFRGREDWKGTMPDMIRQVMKTVTAKGYAVARLEDYL